MPRGHSVHSYLRPSLVVLALLGSGLWLGNAFHHSLLKSLPAGLSVAGPIHPNAPDEVRFLHDLTYPGDNGPVCEQEIFDQALRLIGRAEHVIVADLFLFNDYLGRDSTAHRRLSHAVADALIARRRARPAMTIVVITDPVNHAYGGGEAAPLRALREAGIPVVLTDLNRLRDSNPLWSGFWRFAVKPSGTSPGGWLPHPFSPDAGRIGLRSWLALLNFKANHRKIIIADTPRRGGPDRELAALVMSANPHDGSSAHGNVALAVRGPVIGDLLRSEQAVLSFSGSSLRLEPFARLVPSASTPASGWAGVQLVTEGAIRAALLDAFASAGPGDAIDIAMFYLADRHVIAALKAAASRGAVIRLLLDPNRDAFGYAKDGVPNKPVAAELHAASDRIRIRWYDTRGEQFHSKLILVRRPGQTTLLAGSANLTRRNIGDFNLETDLALRASPEQPAIAAATAYFDDLWSNRRHPCSLPYEAGAGSSPFRTWKYRLQEATGLGTF